MSVHVYVSVCVCECVCVFVSLLCMVKLHWLIPCSACSIPCKVYTMWGAVCLSLGVMCYHSQYVRLTFK